MAEAWPGQKVGGPLSLQRGEKGVPAPFQAWQHSELRRDPAQSTCPKLPWDSHRTFRQRLANEPMAPQSLTIKTDFLKVHSFCLLRSLL